MSGPRSPLHVEIDGEGPALVLLHGGGGGASDLADLRDRLRAGRRIIAPDQRAHGRSPDLGDLSYAAMAADTAALLDELGVHAADVVGWSDGGIIGLFVARDRPDLVGRLVAISANVSWAPPAPAAMREASFEWLRAATAADVTMPAGREELPGAVDAWPTIVEKLRAMWQGDPGITLADLARIDAPVLYLAGDHDVVRNEHTLAMFEATPNAQLAIVPDADHWVAQRPISIVVPIIERFLAGAAQPA
jgi:pimeloyl-ACP methyl ester carboxylesterase